MKVKTVKMRYETPVIDVLQIKAKVITDSNGLNNRGDDGTEESGGWDDLV